MPSPSAGPPVLLSTSSVLPESTAAAFEIAASLGYDGIEVMVWSDTVTQDATALRGLVRHYGLPVGSVHAPCLAVSQRVWSTDPWERLTRAGQLASDLDATIVVVHPPFRWQRGYARGFADGLARLGERFAPIQFAVENMYPLRGFGGLRLVPYSPGWDPTKEDYSAYTLDISHCAVSGTDCLAMADAMADRLAHVHLGDGVGKGTDEHLVPGRGSQRCAELLRSLAGRGFAGSVVVEVATRRVPSRTIREEDLRQSLDFALRHLRSR